MCSFGCVIARVSCCRGFSVCVLLQRVHQSPHLSLSLLFCDALSASRPRISPPLNRCPDVQREREARRREIMSACRALPPGSLNAGLRVQAPKCCRMPSPNSFNNSASRQVERFAAIFTQQAFLPEKSENHARSKSIRGWRGEDLQPSETADALDTRHRAGHDACTPPVRTLLCCFGTEKGQEKPDQKGRQERRKQDDAP